jgi:hypothetical protein
MPAGAAKFSDTRKSRAQRREQWGLLQSQSWSSLGYPGTAQKMPATEVRHQRCGAIEEKRR